jgi:transposase
VVAYPAETTEAFCDGHVRAFAFFGGVPKSILYDNLWTPPVQDELLAAGGIGCVNLSGLSLERTRSWP